MGIVVDRGLYTSIKISIPQDIDFTYIEKIVFTLKNNYKDKPIIVFDMFKAGEYNLEITPEQSKLIKSCAVYDFDLITIDNKRYKITETSNILLRDGVGNCYD